MPRRMLTGICLAMALAPAMPLAPAATAQTVDEIVARNIQAKGGMEKIKALQSVRMSGKMVMGQGMEVPLTVMSKRPKMMRTEFTFQGMTGIQAYDGKVGWGVMPFSGKKEPEAMPEEQVKMMDEQADFDGAMVDYKEKGHKLELVGKEQVEGAEAFKLKITRKSGEVSFLYLDTETYLEIKTESKRHIRGQEIEGESVMGDYKEVGGILFAHSMESGAKGSPQKQKMVIEKIELNPELPDSLFLAPAGLQAAAPADTAKAASAASDTAQAAGAAGGAAKTAGAKATETQKAGGAKKPEAKSKKP